MALNLNICIRLWVYLLPVLLVNASQDIHSKSMAMTTYLSLNCLSYSHSLV